MEWIDFHAHILPHMDHGSVRTETGKNQLALMQSAGVQTVCATSHFYPQEVLPATFVQNRRESLKRLLQAYGNHPRPAIILGAEVLICNGMEEMDGIEELCLEGTNLLLLEMPFTRDSWNRALFKTVREIADRGIRPVMAHVDRYPAEIVDELFRMGLHGQLNAESLTRLLKPKHLMRWIEEGRIVAFGSDLHGSDPKGYAPFQKLSKQIPTQFERVMASTAELLKDAKRY